MFTVGIVLLPIALQGLAYLCDIVLLQQSQDFLEQMLPAAFICLDQDQLAEGRPVLQEPQVETQLRQCFSTTIPPFLRGRLCLDSIEIIARRIRPDANHWMGEDQPLELPLIVLHAVFQDCQGQDIHLHQAIEILLD